jgi:hypothetical protein
VGASPRQINHLSPAAEPQHPTSKNQIVRISNIIVLRIIILLLLLLHFYHGSIIISIVVVATYTAVKVHQRHVSSMTNILGGGGRIIICATSIRVSSISRNITATIIIIIICLGFSHMAQKSNAMVDH